MIQKLLFSLNRRALLLRGARPCHSACCLVSGALVIAGTGGCTAEIEGHGQVVPVPINGQGTETGTTSAGMLPVGGSTAGTGGANSGTTGATSSTGSSATATGGVQGPCEPLTSRRLRRLSLREIANVVSDLFGADHSASVYETLPFEPTLGGFDNQDSALFVSLPFQEAMAELAESLAQQMDLDALAPCETADTETCRASFITTFAERAYGGPPSADEIARLSTVAATAEDYATSVRLVVQAVLLSPHFLYISELGSDDVVATSQQPVALTGYEVASQLSFLLRGSRPDEPLLQAVEATGLASPDEIRFEAERLLADPRAQQELTRFVWGWLEMAPIADAPKSNEAFPELTPAVVDAMQEEFDAFVSARLQGGGTIASFLTEPSTHVPEALLPIYGDDYVAGTGLVPVRRVGVLSLPGLLTYHASNQHSGPIERGLFVRRQLLCQDVPPPPKTVLEEIAENPINEVDQTQTTRQKYAAHVDEPVCANCHLFFDPIGFGLEEMDGIGRFRTTENGLPVDSSGELAFTDVDGPFTGVAELSNKLAQSDTFKACAVKHFFRFAQARASTPADECVIENWSSQVAQAGGGIQQLVLALIADRMFTTREDDR